jgi:outer membrane immunogenic protein
MKTKLLIGAIVASFAFAGTANAGPWHGCYLGVHGGYAAGLADISGQVPGVINFSLDSLGADGAAYGGMAGCDVEVAPRIVAGVWGDYTWHDVDFNASFSGGGGTFFSTAGLDERWGVGGRLGYLVTPGALAYAKVGYTNAEMNNMPNMKGWLVGGGSELSIHDGWYLQADYSYVMFDTETLLSVVDLDMNVHTTRIGLLYKFRWSELH